MIYSKRQSMLGHSRSLLSSPAPGLGLSVGDIVSAGSTNDVYNSISKSYLPTHITGVKSATQISAIRYAMKLEEGDLDDEIAFDLWDKACIGSFLPCAAGGGESVAKKIVGGRTAGFMNKLMLNAGVPAYERHMVLAAIYYRFGNKARWSAQKAMAKTVEGQYSKEQAYLLKIEADKAQAIADKKAQDAANKAQYTAELDVALQEALDKANKAKADAQAAAEQAEVDAAAFIAEKDKEKQEAATEEKKIASWAWAGVVGLGLFYLITRGAK
jgi:hypothetical protein